MKKFVLILIASSFAASAVMADPVRWQTQRREVIRNQWHHNGHHGGHSHRQHGWGWAPWISAAAIGTTIYLAQQPSLPPTTVYISPPVVNDPARVAYFCQPIQQYYPYTPTCPVPWQVVSY